MESPLSVTTVQIVLEPDAQDGSDMLTVDCQLEILVGLVEINIAPVSSVMAQYDIDAQDTDLRE
jgi:hypothetical protein